MDQNKENNGQEHRNDAAVQTASDTETTEAPGSNGDQCISQLFGYFVAFLMRFASAKVKNTEADQGQLKAQIPTVVDAANADQELLLDESSFTAEETTQTLGQDKGDQTNGGCEKQAQMSTVEHPLGSANADLEPPQDQPSCPTEETTQTLGQDKGDQINGAYEKQDPNSSINPLTTVFGYLATTKVATVFYTGLARQLKGTDIVYPERDQTKDIHDQTKDIQDQTQGIHDQTKDIHADDAIKEKLSNPTSPTMDDTQQALLRDISETQIAEKVTHPSDVNSQETRRNPHCCTKTWHQKQAVLKRTDNNRPNRQCLSEEESAESSSLVMMEQYNGNQENTAKTAKTKPFKPQTRDKVTPPSGTSSSNASLITDEQKEDGNQKQGLVTSINASNDTQFKHNKNDVNNNKNNRSHSTELQNSQNDSIAGLNEKNTKQRSAEALLKNTHNIKKQQGKNKAIFPKDGTAENSYQSVMGRDNGKLRSKHELSTDGDNGKMQLVNSKDLIKGYSQSKEKIRATRSNWDTIADDQSLKTLKKFIEEHKMTKKKFLQWIVRMETAINNEYQHCVVKFDPGTTREQTPQTGGQVVPVQVSEDHDTDDRLLMDPQTEQYHVWSNSSEESSAPQSVGQRMQEVEGTRVSQQETGCLHSDEMEDTEVKQVYGGTYYLSQGGRVVCEPEDSNESEEVDEGTATDDEEADN